MEHDRNLSRNLSDQFVADDRLAILGGWAITFALAIIFLWFGSLFTAYEESGVAGSS